MDPTFRAFLGSWNWRPEVILVVVGLAVAYLAGWRRLRERGAAAAPASAPLGYLGGLAILALALLSPIDAFGSWLFIMHMLQHELLVMAAPPLLLLANPLAAFLWALPLRSRHMVGRWLVRGAALRRAWGVATLMPVAWLLYVGTLWGWHYPPAYEVSLRNDLVHDAQHVSFFLTALLFWWPVINPAPRLRARVPYAFRIAYVAAAAGQNTFLAFIITITGRVLYAYYAGVPRLWGLTALEDQKIGGVTMWVGGGMMYLGVVLILVARMLDREEAESGVMGENFGRTTT